MCCCMYARVYSIWPKMTFFTIFNVEVVEQRTMIIKNNLAYFFWTLLTFHVPTVTTPISKNGIFSYFWHVYGSSITILQDFRQVFGCMKYLNLFSDWEKDSWKNTKICGFQRPKNDLNRESRQKRVFHFCAQTICARPIKPYMWWFIMSTTCFL